MTLKVSRIYRHLIKSCRGHSMVEAMIGRTGIDFDRELMIVDERGMFVSQRPSPKRESVGLRSLSQVVPILLDEHHVRLSAPDMPELIFSTERAVGSKCTVQIWDSVCVGREVIPFVSEWFSTYLSREREGRYRLVCMAEDFRRKASAGTAEVAFHDGFPFLILSEESLQELNRRMGGNPIDHDRFRATIVIAGCSTANEEDSFDRIKIGDVEFEGHGLCDRCPIPGIDQETGKKDGRPLKALVKYRRMKPDDDRVQFGRNFNHRSTGVIRIGDRIEVL